MGGTGTDVQKYSNKRIVGCGDKQGNEENEDKTLHYRVNDRLFEEIAYKGDQKILRRHQVGADVYTNVPDSGNGKSRGPEDWPELALEK